MRQKILNWNRKKNGKPWEPFLEFFETTPVTDEEYDFILKKEKENGAKNFISHSESHFNPVRKCLNSVYNKDKFVEQDLKKNLRAPPKTQTTKFTIFNNKNPIKTLSQKHLR